MSAPIGTAEAPTTFMAGATAPTTGKKLRAAMNSSPFYMLIILVLLVAFFAFMRPNTFASTFNIRNIFLDASTLMILSIGMTYVMIAGGFDLSIGSVLVFAGVLAAKTMEWMGTDNALTIIVGLLVSLVGGLAWGLFNGFCISRLRVSALITTLGTMGSALGLSYLLTGGSDVRTVPNTLIKIGTGSFHSVPYLVIITVVFTIIGMIWLHMTRFGRHTYIVGSNPEAARRAGINVGNHLMALYALSGLLAGIAAMLSLGRFSTTTLEGHGTDPLEAITAVVLGGTSLVGGSGTIIGTVIGVFIPAVLANGFIIMGIEPFWQMVVIGFVVIAAVYVDQLKRQSRDR